MPSHQDEERRRARGRAIDDVTAHGFRVTKEIYGDADRAGDDPELWRPYRGCHRSLRVGLSMLLIGKPMVETGVISRDERNALMIASAFRGTFQSRGPGVDEQACAELAMRAMRERGVFERRDHEVVEEAFAGLTARRGESLSPLQELFADAHGVQGMLPINAESSLLRCIEDVTTESGVVLPRTLSELGSVAIDPEAVVHELENERRRIADQQFHRPGTRELVDRSRAHMARSGLPSEQDLLEVVSRRFRDDVDGGVAPGTALMRGVESLRYYGQNLRLPSAEELSAWQVRYGPYRSPAIVVGPQDAPSVSVLGDPMRWAPASESRGDLPESMSWLAPGPAIEPGRESVDETLSMIDQVLGGQDMPEPGSIDAAGDAGDPEPPAPRRPPHADGPTSTL